MNIEIKKYYSYEDIQNRIYIPSFQRDLNLEIVNNIKQYIIDQQTKNLPICIGVIDLCKCGDGQLYVTDGRHRLAALELFYNETKIDVEFYAIIYTVSSFEEMKKIFILRNSGLPVPEFILNPPLGKKELVKEINMFMLTLPLVKIPTPGSKTNKPTINLTKFMEYLIDSKYLELINTLDEFIFIFWSINEKIKQKKKNETWRKKFKVTESMLEKISEKCTDKKIYLGLLSNYADFDDYL